MLGELFELRAQDLVDQKSVPELLRMGLAHTSWLLTSAYALYIYSIFISK